MVRRPRRRPAPVFPARCPRLPRDRRRPLRPEPPKEPEGSTTYQYDPDNPSYQRTKGYTMPEELLPAFREAFARIDAPR